MDNNKNCNSKQKMGDLHKKSNTMRDNYRFSESNTSRDEYIVKKSKRGTRAGKKVKDLKNQKKCMDLILQNLAAQCAQNHKKKIVNENNLSSDKPCNISSHAENSKPYKEQANGWSYRRKRAGKQVKMNYECKKVATFLSALAQECESH